MSERKIEFTHVNIKPIVRGRKYVSESTACVVADCVPGFKADTTIGGATPEQCLQKTETFLMVKLTDDQYTIHK